MLKSERRLSFDEGVGAWHVDTKSADEKSHQRRREDGTEDGQVNSCMMESSHLIVHREMYLQGNDAETTLRQARLENYSTRRMFLNCSRRRRSMKLQN